VTTPDPEALPACPNCGSDDLALEVRIRDNSNGEDAYTSGSDGKWFRCNRCGSEWEARPDEIP